MTREEEIERVHGNGTHVVILGAGASLASAFRNPEKNGKSLPLMNNVVQVLDLVDITATLPVEIRQYENNFEKLYSELSINEDFKKQRISIENRVYEYFSELELPDEPTIYDYLILSLRHQKDVIATFNWDPFLYQAYVRNGEFAKPPGILFLHGCVALGYDEEDGRSGPVNWYSKKTGNQFKPVEILFPVDQKDYNSHPFIKKQWIALQERLKVAERVTIFGYSAPETDVEAIELLQDAWGNVEERNMEEFELIDIRNEHEVKKSWKTFIHSHHYGYCTSFFDSSLANHPRRSVESYRHWAMPSTPSDAFQEGNNVPQDFKNLKEMWEWFQPLIEAEKKVLK